MHALKEGENFRQAECNYPSGKRGSSLPSQLPQLHGTGVYQEATQTSHCHGCRAETHTHVLMGSGQGSKPHVITSARQGPLPHVVADARQGPISHVFTGACTPLSRVPGRFLYPIFAQMPGRNLYPTLSQVIPAVSIQVAMQCKLLFKVQYRMKCNSSSNAIARSMQENKKRGCTASWKAMQVVVEVGKQQ